MIYDEKLDEDLPVYQILDYFINYESPEDTLNFLKRYDVVELKDIFRNSIYIDKMFSIDFIYNLSYPYLMYFAKTLCEAVDSSISRLLMYQIVQSDMSDIDKNIFRNFMFVNNATTPHPYRGVVGNLIQHNDLSIRNSLLRGTLCDDINSIEINDFNKKIKSYLLNSIYVNRILQPDIIAWLDYEHLYVIVNEVLNFSTSSQVHTFMKRILLCDNLDNDIKFEISRMMLNKKYGDFITCRDRATYDNLISIESFEEQMIMLDLSSDDVKRDVIYHIFVHNPKRIIDIYNTNRRLLDMFFPLGDLPENKKFIAYCNDK